MADPPLGPTQITVDTHPIVRVASCCVKYGMISAGSAMMTRASHPTLYSYRSEALCLGPTGPRTYRLDHVYDD